MSVLHVDVHANKANGSNCAASRASSSTPDGIGKPDMISIGHGNCSRWH
jgi:hypothetical protein